MRALIDELIEKYEDVRDTADEWVERNLADEFLEDLKDLRKNG